MTITIPGKPSPASSSAASCPRVGGRIASSPRSEAGEALTLAGTNLVIHDGSEMCRWRAETFLTKEPHTLKWLDTLTDEDVLWDIGANIGVYSLYAASVRGCKVVAFEPEALNYAELVRNIRLNGLEHLITPYLLALGDTDGLLTLNINDTRIGGSCHTAGPELGPDLQPRAPVHRQPVFAARMDSLAEMDIPDPTALKVDVDGLEHLVVNGGERVLSDSVRTCIWELSSNLYEHDSVIDTLAAYKLFHDGEQWFDAQRKSGPFEGTGECIFTRSPSPETVHESIDESIRFRSTNPETTEGIGHPVAYKGWTHLISPWSDALYRDLLDMFPSDYMRPLAETGRVKGYPERNALLLHESIDESIADESMARFWIHFMNQFLLDPDYHQALFLAAGLEPQPCKFDAMLTRDLPGYAINPHTDRPHRLLTALYYLPPAGTFDSALGTSFYRRHGNQPDPKGEHRSRLDFSLQHTVPYAANTGLVFARTDYSYHGVERTERPRDLLMVDLRRIT